MTAEQSEVDYKSLAETPGKLMEHLGDDAAKWATFYCQMHPGADWGDIVGWFANAIENSWETRTRRAEPQTRPVTLSIVPKTDNT